MVRSKIDTIENYENRNSKLSTQNKIRKNNKGKLNFITKNLQITVVSIIILKLLHWCYYRVIDRITSNKKSKNHSTVVVGMMVEEEDDNNDNDNLNDDAYSE